MLHLMCTPFQYDRTTPLEADTGMLIVLHGRLPHLWHQNKYAKTRYTYALHLINWTVAI